jgi:GNAT superfamily N-acetyltransferase
VGPAIGVRAAGVDDLPEVVRLAELMYVSLGVGHPEPVWAAWRRVALEALRSDLGPDLAVVVVDHPDAGSAGAAGAGPGRLVACGVATIGTRLPNPWLEDRRIGYVQWMSTEPEFRRRGLARAVLAALLRWYEERGVHDVELHASTAGAPLYRTMGFWEGSTGVALRRRSWDPPPP